MNVNKVLTNAYEEKTLGEHGKNEPKTNPIKANKMPKQTQYKAKQTQFQRQKMLLCMKINPLCLLWIPAFAEMTAISRRKDEGWILVDCRCGIADN